jgi:Zn-dependent metalloprotease
MLSCRNPFNCILPPYMMREIVDRGSRLQRDKAVRTIRFTSQLKTQRLTNTGAEGKTVWKPSGAKNRLIYTADHNSSLPGRMVRKEGDQATGDLAVDEAYEGAGATFDLYWDAFGRNSIDGNGMNLESTVHYQKNYDNAFWNGSQMVYGDGDEDLPVEERLFNRFTISIDVIGHELAHGVTQHEANLIYMNQSGALNESISDVFGSLVKQKNRNQAALEADWIIGEGLFTENVNGVGIRSMKDPGAAYNDPILGKDPQPAHMNDYYSTTDDNGGVHLNSGIPNHAFYLVATELGGYAWEKAGRIWYIALRDKLQPISSFQDAASQTFTTAGELFGSGSLEQAAVRKGWAEVGIDVQDTSNNPGCLPGVYQLISRYIPIESILKREKKSLLKNNGRKLKRIR